MMVAGGAVGGGAVGGGAVGGGAVGVAAVGGAAGRAAGEVAGEAAGERRWLTAAVADGGGTCRHRPMAPSATQPGRPAPIHNGGGHANPRKGPRTPGVVAVGHPKAPPVALWCTSSASAAPRGSRSSISWALGAEGGPRGPMGQV
jgi:hypothetical protein